VAAIGQETEAPSGKAKPSLTVPQLLAVGAFLVFVVLAWLELTPKI
jgi:hypothetical protein